MIKKIIQNFKTSSFYRFGQTSFSQEGEDLILARAFEGVPKGFYVDVGAYHPVRFSNTYLFYKRGWRGINIEARPGSKILFDKIRPNDTNIEAAISDKKETLTYYMFNEPALNGFSKPLTDSRQGMNYNVIKELKIETCTLDEILSKHINDQKIDFMSIDVEGLDLQVLKSNDWNKFKPTFLLVEDLSFDFSDVASSSTFRLLHTHNYNLWGKTLNTVIYKLCDY